MSLQELKLIPRVTSNREFFDALNIFDKSVGSLTSNIKLFTTSPTQFLKDFASILNEGVRIGVISKTFADEKKAKLSDKIKTGLQSPERFKASAQRRLLQLKNIITFKKTKKTK